MLDIYYFDKTVKKAKPEDLPKIKNKKIWIDVYDFDKQDEEVLKKNFKIHPITIEDMHNNLTRIKIEQFPNYLFCVFYGLEKVDNKIQIKEFDFILGKNFLISNHIKPFESFENLKNNKIILTSLFHKPISFLFHKLVDMEIDNYFPLMEEIDEEIELIDESIIDNKDPAIISKILKLKRNIVLLKKRIYQQREKISFIAKNTYPKFIDQEVLPYFRDLYDHSIRITDAIDNQREAISNSFDIYMSAISNRLNEVMKVLSVIATISLPLTVISSIYGTNFEYLPGSTMKYGFFIMLGVMFLMSLLMLLFFKKRGWF